MSKPVTFGQLQKTLNSFGFESQQAGSHVIFRHLKTGAVLTVPNTEGTVRPIYVSTAARQIANSGIATASTFEIRLEKAAKDGTKIKSSPEQVQNS
jgi:predicted RNA binding protein YcfA (HicA-like mRNA interferase family)